MQNDDTMTDSVLDRRAFLGFGALAAGGLAVGNLVGCAPKSASEAPAADADASTDAASGQTAGKWYGASEDVASFVFAEELDCEILIAGAGHGGVTAALAAGEAGAKTIVIEKGANYGTMREYIGVINCKAQLDAGIKLDGITVTKELMRYASYNANQRVIQLWANESGATLDWIMSYLEPQGFGLVAEGDVGTGWHDIYPVYPVLTMIQTPTMLGGSPIKDPEDRAAQDALVAAATAAGVEFRYTTPLVQCIVENGKVTGVVAGDSDGYVRINASKGVIIATGGYEGNLDLVQELQPEIAASLASNTGYPQNIGDGIKAGIWAGGRKDETTAFMLFDRGALPPDAVAGLPADKGDMFWMGSQPWLKVNLHGERFCNEYVPYDWPIHAIGLEPDKTWIPIWDANWQQNIAQFHTLGCSRIDKSPTAGITQSFIMPMIEGMNGGLMEKGYIQQADTPEELGAKLGIPGDTLKATIDRYNELAIAGVDSDFGKPAEGLIPLLTPPYFGVRQGSQSLCSLDGLRIDPNCRVLSEADNTPVLGLWAIGNASGSFFAHNYPELVIGVACGRTLTQARHSVRDILGIAD